MNLKDIFWDYTFTEEELNDLLHGRIQNIGALSRSALFIRMLEYMNWFDVAKHMNKDLFLANITREFIDQLKEKDLQEGLSFVRTFLLGETVSIAR